MYAGTGDSVSGADSEAGLGVFKTTNGGDSWSLVPGSERIAKDRAVSRIVIDPRRPTTIYVGTISSLHGGSAVPGGFGQPPNAPALGLYRSRDGGKTFTLLLKTPTQSVYSGSATLRSTRTTSMRLWLPQVPTARTGARSRPTEIRRSI